MRAWLTWMYLGFSFSDIVVFPHKKSHGNPPNEPLAKLSKPILFESYIIKVSYKFCINFGGWISFPGAGRKSGCATKEKANSTVEIYMQS